MRGQQEAQSHVFLSCLWRSLHATKGRLRTPLHGTDRSTAQHASLRKRMQRG